MNSWNLALQPQTRKEEESDVIRIRVLYNVPEELDDLIRQLDGLIRKVKVSAQHGKHMCAYVDVDLPENGKHQQNNV